MDASYETNDQLVISSSTLTRSLKYSNKSAFGSIKEAYLLDVLRVSDHHYVLHREEENNPWTFTVELH